MTNISQLPGRRKCERLLFQLIFHSNVCPKCQGLVKQTDTYFWCKVCRIKLRPKASTWLRDSKLNSQQLLGLIFCWQRNIHPGAVKSLLGISYTTSERWYSRFRQHLPRDLIQLQGVVEVDEAFFGRQKFANQRIVMGAIERQSKRVKLAPIPDRDQDSLEIFLEQYVHHQSLLNTDAWSGYYGLDWYGFGHHIHNHSRGQFKGTNQIENVWSVAKRQLRRMYGQIRTEKLEEYLSEWEARHNFTHLFQDPFTYLQNTLFRIS